MDTLDISRRGLPKKEDLVDKFCHETRTISKRFIKNFKENTAKKIPNKSSTIYMYEVSY